MNTALNVNHFFFKLQKSDQNTLQTNIATNCEVIS
jgi:hypothetical protein